MSITRILSDNKWSLENFNCLLSELENGLDTTNQSISCLSQGGGGPCYLQITKLVEVQLLNKKQNLEARLLQLNGTYYQDPNSLIHLAYYFGRTDEGKTL